MSIRIPDHTPVFDADTVVALVDGLELFDTFIQGLLGSNRFG
jgi:hypothetical protein